MRSSSGFLSTFYLYYYWSFRITFISKHICRTERKHFSLKKWIKRLYTWSLDKKTHQLTRSSLPSCQYGPLIIFSIHLQKVEGYHPRVMISHTPRTKVNRFRCTSPIVHPSNTAMNNAICLAGRDKWQGHLLEHYVMQTCLSLPPPLSYR